MAYRQFCFALFRASSPKREKRAKSPGEYPIVCKPYSRKAKEFKEFVAGGCADPGSIVKTALGRREGALRAR